MAAQNQNEASLKMKPENEDEGNDETTKNQSGTKNNKKP